jgi:hypothetical protein
MFSFGIFTTHIPYIAFVAFYVYFLIFGVEKANDGAIRLTERSVQIERHIHDFHPAPVSAYQVQKQLFSEDSAHELLCCERIKQRWKISCFQSFHRQDFTEDTLFCRPPPALA